MKKNQMAKQLTTREQCVDKLSIWYGGADNYYHGLKEVLVNAIDEISDNFDNGEIAIRLESDHKTLNISDTGRGIPLFIKDDNGTCNYQLLFETLFAGTKYDDSAEGTGCNGVGTCVLNHTSERFTVISTHDGICEMVDYTNGGILQDKSVNKCDKDLHGTTVRFKLDEEVYPVTLYDDDEIKSIIKHYGATLSNIKITFYIGDEKIESYGNNTLLQYFKSNIEEGTSKPVNAPKERYILPNVLKDGKEEYIDIEAVITTSVDPIQETYLNHTFLSEGGKIVEGVIDGIQDACNKYCIENKKFPKGVKEFSKKDIQDSCSFVCSVLNNNADFSNQTKLTTKNNKYKKYAKEYIRTILEVEAKENNKNFEQFIEHLLLVNKNNNANASAREKLNRTLKKKINTPNDRPEGLTDCVIHDETSELFIGEGRSACGALAKARDSKTQAIIPVRGKILNCLKANVNSIQNNQTIINLMKAIGTGILEEFDIELFRYGRIILAMDADSDGFQIRQLILCMLWELAKPLVTGGYVYFAETPLYKVVKANGEVVFIYTESEKEGVLKTIEGKYTISRIKGLGEAEPQLLYDTTMNPETRNITRVVVEDEKAFEANLIAWMGKETTERKKRILKDIDKYVDVE